MAEQMSPLQVLRGVCQAAAFNRWLDLEVASAGEGEVELRLRWREEFGQYSGFLHAGIIAGLLDTACGFAAYTVAGNVLASHFSMNCIRPASGETFVVRGKVTRAGKLQVFTTAELFVLDKETPVLVATGETLLIPVEGKLSP